MAEIPTIFGIDLGTTYSCIAYVDNTGRPTVVANAEGELTTPSVIFFENPGNIVVGKEAKNSALSASDRVVEMVKRQMGNSAWRFSYNNTQYTPEELSSYILRKVVSDAEQLYGSKITDVVITCPAYFDSAQREATARAGELADLKVWQVIEEPTAAAIDYGLQDSANQNVLVYDLGGGTFDITMIEIKDGSLTVIAVGGDHDLGGRNWDEAVVNYVAEEWMRQAGSSDDPRSSDDTLQDLWNKTENAKKALTSRTETRISITHAGKAETITLTRDKFDELTSGLLERTIQLTNEMLDIARQKGYTTFDQVLLVGGSSKMPQVMARLTREFAGKGITPKIFDPDQAVAKGAAVYGQRLAIGQQIRIEIAKIMGQSVANAANIDIEQTPAAVTAQATRLLSGVTGMTPEAIGQAVNGTVNLVATHSYGVIVLDPATRREEIFNLIVAQTKLPADNTQQFGTDGANASSVNIRVVQDEVMSVSVADVSLGKEMGNAVIEGLPAGLPHAAPINVTFSLKEGILHVTGVEPSSGKRIEADITTTEGTSAEELAEAKARVGLTKVS